MGCSRAFSNPKCAGAPTEELLGLGWGGQQRDPWLRLGSAPQEKGCASQALARLCLALEAAVTPLGQDSAAG